MKKLGYIFGRRIRGDIELDRDPLTNQLGEILAPGARIANRPEQGILEASATQNYVVGSRRVVADSVFRYCFTKEIQEPMKGAFNGAQVAGHSFFIGNSGIAAHDAFVSVVTVDCTDVVPENHLQGGYLCRYAAPAIRCRIASNAVGTGAVVVVTLADPLPVLIAANDKIHLYPSHYRQLARWGDITATGVVGDTFTASRSVVCIPWIPLVADRWFWGQTSGFAIAGCGNQANLVGKTPMRRKVYFDGIGWAWHTTFLEADTYRQVAGYLLFDSDDGYAPNGDEAYMLQLAP